MKKLLKITEKQISERGVQALADRPNVVQQYGQSGLTATQLKLWFDKLATFLAEKINAIQEVLCGSDAASYLRLELAGLDREKEKREDFVYSLQDLCDSFKDGNFVKYLLAYSSESDRDKKNVQEILYDTAKKIEAAETALKTYKDLLLSKDGAKNIGLPENYNGAGKTLADLIGDLLNGTVAAKLVLNAYGFSSSDKTIMTQKSLQAYLNDVKDALQAGKGSVLLEKINERYTKTESDAKLKQGLETKVNIADVMENFSGEDINNKQKVLSAYAFNKVYEKIIGDIGNADTKAKNALKNVDYDPVTGVITFTDGNGNPVSFDLPSEKILKSGASYYDDTSRTLHLVLMDDSDIEIDVSRLVDEYYGDDETIELFQAEKKKIFRLKPSFKEVVDSYGKGIEDNAKEIKKKVAIDDIVDGFGSEDSQKPVSARAASELNQKVVEIEDTLTGAYVGASYDRETGTLRLHKTDGTDDSVSFPLESFVTDASIDPKTNIVTLTVANGKNVSFDLSALVDYYYGDGATIEVYDDPDDGFKHKIRVKADFLNGVKANIASLNERLTQAEKEIKALSSVEKFGSIGRADGTTITMDEETGALTAHMLELATGNVLDFVEIDKQAYLALEEKAENTLYLISDGNVFSLAFKDKTIFSGGVYDTESGTTITLRTITQSAYEGLEEKDSNKLYLIVNDGKLTFAFGKNICDFVTSVNGKTGDVSLTAEDLHLSKAATSGSYNDLADLPDLSDVATSGSWNDLLDKPEVLDGKDGTTFTPSVSAEGVLSWTNDGNKQNPSPVNIRGKDGKDGAAGKDGATGAAGATGNGIKSITATYAQSSSTSQPGESSFSPTRPTPTAGRYMWTKLAIAMTNGSTSYVYLMDRNGTNGTNGTNGSNGKDGTNGSNGADGARGSVWNSGTDMSGSSSTANYYSYSGAPASRVGDYYLNTSSGNIYRCTTAGTGASAKWTYQGCIKGIKGDKGDKGESPSNVMTTDTAQTVSGKKTFTNAAGVTAQDPSTNQRSTLSPGGLVIGIGNKNASSSSPTKYLNLNTDGIVINEDLGGQSGNSVQLLFPKSGGTLMVKEDDYYQKKGAIFFRYGDSTSPATIHGGSWTKISERFIYCGTGTAEGGSNSHTMTIEELPSHDHLVVNCDNGYPIGQGFGANHPGYKITSIETQDNIGGQWRGDFVGSGKSIDIRPAYITCYTWRRTSE